MNKLLLDTNFLVYSIDKDSKYFKITNDILLKHSSELYTTSKNLSEFISVITRYPQIHLTIEETLTVLKDFRDLFTILYPTEDSYQLFLNLLSTYKPAGLKIHDFEIISIALANDISTIATFNRKDFDSITEIKLYDMNYSA